MEHLTAEIAQFVEQWTIMQQVPGSIPTPNSTWLGVDSALHLLWVGKVSTSIDDEWRNNVHSK